MPGTGFGSGDPERKSQGRPEGENQADGLGLSWALQAVEELVQRRMSEPPKVQTAAIRPASEAAPGCGAWWSGHPWNPSSQWPQLA